MITRAISLAIFAVCAMAQPPMIPGACPAGYTCTLKPVPQPVYTPIAGTPPCPTSFYAAGAGYSRGASPSTAPFYAIATPLTKCGSAFQAYSFTASVVIPSGSGKTLSFTSTSTSGAAIPVKQIGPVNIFSFGTLGAAVGPSTTLGANWGGFAVVPLGKSWNAIPIGQSVNGKWMAGFAIGRSW